MCSYAETTAAFCSKLSSDLSEPEADIIASQRSVESSLPPPPVAFRRLAPTARGCDRSVKLGFPPELACIQSMKRNACREIYASEMCPVGSAAEQQNLWTAVEDIFL